MPRRAGDSWLLKSGVVRGVADAKADSKPENERTGQLRITSGGRRVADTKSRLPSMPDQPQATKLRLGAALEARTLILRFGS